MNAFTVMSSVIVPALHSLFSFLFHFEAQDGKMNVFFIQVKKQVTIV